MQLRQQIFFFLLMLISAWGAMAQQKNKTTESEPEEIDYREEYNYGINWNTNGDIIGGFVFKYGWHAGKNMYQSVGFELVNVRHPKEQVLTSRLTGNSFTAFKTNYLFVLRPQYGREFVLFRKGPEEGVHLNFVTAAGPSIGMLKPYYVLFDEVNNDPQRARSVRYDPDRHPLNFIYGSGSFFEGLNQMNFTLGAHLKTSFTLEFGRINNSVFGIEVGGLIEAYPSPVVIIRNAQNQSTFGSFFITVYYGNKY